MRSFICILIFIPHIVLAQTDTLGSTLIVYVGSYNRGIYRSLQEFRNNTPTITNTFTFDGHELWLTDSLSRNERKIEKQDVWGFCDGKQIYIVWRNYNVLSEIGRFCYFRENGRPPFPLSILSFAAPHSRELIVSINTGTVYVLTKKVMRRLLREDDKILLAQFETEKRKKRKLHQYLLLYNQRNDYRIKP